ncbi:Hsp33 family molecular chaperone HslO [Natronospira bacteriovora]|uniref:33 kDa chaperonin n=1 Tax=Natronospira bacteriovora TaxID=3069753 RepID=A0ABU0W457_9GAMM|nr:Hsp33 family molecular chaperone HslO [Natronospira sp. AB-CW4]MDQ2068751.1 Hsp33 family molecular chaperone HslO [Natronospira sp. AB-CW4]
MSESGKQADSLHRFLFEEAPVRGELVHLDSSWQAALEHSDYPAPVRSLLGQAMAAASLLASTLKFEGAMTLQVQGDGPVSLMVVQCSSELVIRGTAQVQSEVASTAGFRELLGEGTMAITIEQQGQSERYQGIVPMEGDDLATCLEAYFDRSEQLPTRLWLTADSDAASGLLLQLVPGEDEGGEGWNRVITLADTVKGEELRVLPARQLLHRLYHEENLRLFEARPVSFRCTCSREKIVDVLRRLGQEEIEEVLEEQGQVQVACEFCGRHYYFDRVDAAALFIDASSGQSTTRH